MQTGVENDEIIVDFSKVFKILNYRKFLIAKIFTVFIIIFAVLTFITPKKFETNADLYVNKSNNTNLTELNPYAISSLTGGEGISSLLGAGASNLQNEIEIIQSPLIMDRVIKDNNLRYKKGPKKGEFLSTRDFLKKNISIENRKGSNIISISYKSKTPLQSYNVINSIITNYQKTNEEINTKKAVNDKKLLEGSYAQANKTLNQKLSAMKHSGGMPTTAMAGMGMMAALRGHSRAISGAVGSVQSQVVEGQKSQIAVDQEVEKLKLVKTKLEWTNLVEKMSKETSNVIVLKHPELKRSFEASEPKLLVNLILGIIFAIFASIFAVILAENTDKSITYSELGDNIIYDIEKNIDDLKLILLANSKKELSLVVFDGFQDRILKDLAEFKNLNIIKASISSKTIDDISNADKLIFASKIGKTSKKIYQQIKNVCAETQKNIYTEII